MELSLPSKVYHQKNGNVCNDYKSKVPNIPTKTGTSGDSPNVASLQPSNWLQAELKYASPSFQPLHLETITFDDTALNCFQQTMLDTVVSQSEYEKCDSNAAPQALQMKDPVDVTAVLQDSMADLRVMAGGDSEDGPALSSSTDTSG